LRLPPLDYLALEDLAAACHASARWTFLCVIAPLRSPQAPAQLVSPDRLVLTR